MSGLHALQGAQLDRLMADARRLAETASAYAELYSSPASASEHRRVLLALLAGTIEDWPPEHDEEPQPAVLAVPRRRLELVHGGRPR